MRHRCITLYLFACATLVFCLPLSAAGQIADSSTRLTPWGEPDLQGIWTNATLTPAVRLWKFTGLVHMIEITRLMTIHNH